MMITEHKYKIKQPREANLQAWPSEPGETTVFKSNQNACWSILMLVSFDLFSDGALSFQLIGTFEEAQIRKCVLQKRGRGSLERNTWSTQHPPLP